jgi:outer membrane protein OmpA-like peptidoglycan-associated protein
MSQACRCKEVECEECPEWIFTLADLIMCMMGLFVILWCLKPGASEPFVKDQANQDLLKALAGIRDAFGYVPDPNSNDPVDIYMISQLLSKLNPRLSPGMGGKTELRPEGSRGPNDTTQALRNGRYEVVGTRVLFDLGKADLNPAAINNLDDILEKIRGHRNIFMVKGHADLDDFPDGGTPQQRMDLSLRRAQAAVDFLVSKGMAADTLRVIGCSTYEPIVERVQTAEARQPNRRVEVQSLDQLVEEYKDTPSEPAKPLPANTPAAENGHALPAGKPE